MASQKEMIDVLASDLATELCKDLDYSEIYELAKVALVRKLTEEKSLNSMVGEYGERYDYIFLSHGIDPFSYGG